MSDVVGIELNIATGFVSPSTREYMLIYGTELELAASQVTTGELVVVSDAVTTWELELAGVLLPVGSFSLTYVAGKFDYVRAVLKYSDLAYATIADNIEGVLELRKVVRANNSVLVTVMSSFVMNSIDLHRGAKNSSISIAGYSTAESRSSQAIDGGLSTYKFTSFGIARFRFPASVSVAPGDAILDPFTTHTYLVTSVIINASARSNGFSYFSEVICDG